MRQRITILSIITALCCSAVCVFAAVPNSINFQGTLTDSSGSPITGSRDFQFFLYADSVGGSSLWNESHSMVNVTDGLFRILLGINSPFPDTLFTGQALWMETVVQSETLAPRKKIVSVPYSIKSAHTDHATRADSATHAVYSDTADWAVAGWTVTHVDTADFAFYADSAGLAGSASEAEHAVYSDDMVVDFFEFGVCDDH